MGTRRLLTALATTVVGLSVASPAAAETQSNKARASQACAGADTMTTSVRRLQKTILCLHNVERRKAGLSTLRWNRYLTGVARKYSRTMVAGRFFSHYSAGRRDHMDRIATSRYTPSVGCWTAGENLYSSVGNSTPRQMMAAWMGSRLHRQNIRHGGWHDFGLGVTRRSTDGAKGGLTVVALFGLRTGRPC